MSIWFKTRLFVSGLVLRQELRPLLFVVGTFAVLAGLLELRYPGHFLWDDNASYYLPCYVFNWRALTTSGTIPEINFHQYLGQLHLGSGQSGALYPPVYLAVGLSRLLFGDARHAIDVLAIGHLLVASLAMYWLLRWLGTSQPLSSLGSLLWVSFPFLVQVSRNWIPTAYAAALVPLNLLFLERLRRHGRGIDVLALGVVKALLFYQGYVQYAVIVALFDGVWLAAHWLAPRSSARSSSQTSGEPPALPARSPTARRQILHYASAVATCSLLAAPAILPVLHAQSISAYRTTTLSYEEFISNTMPLAAFLRSQVMVMTEGAIHLATGAIFFFGLPNLLLVLIAPLIALRRTAVARTTWIAAATSLVALLFTTPLYGLLYSAPVLSSFRWPFKYFTLFLFFGTVSVVSLLDQLTRRGGSEAECTRNSEGSVGSEVSARRAALDLPQLAAIGLLILGILSNVWINAVPSWNRTFGPNRIENDVGEIVAEVDALFDKDNGRVVSLWLSPLEPRLDLLQIFNYSTLVGAYHLGGYDPLIARENLELAMNLEYSNIFRYRIDERVLAYLSSWGVRTFLVPERKSTSEILAGLPRLRQSRVRDGIEVWENLGAQPVAHFLDRPSEPVNLEWGVNEIRIDTEGRSGRLKVAVAPLTGYSYRIESTDGGSRDGGELEVTDDRHLLLDVPPSTARVTLGFRDQAYRIGWAMLVAFLVLLVAIAFRCARSKGPTDRVGHRRSAQGLTRGEAPSPDRPA